MKLKKTDIAAFCARLQRMAIAILERVIKVKPTEESDKDALGYTEANGTITLGFNHPMVAKLDKKHHLAAIEGVFAHEVMHQILTDFAGENQFIKKKLKGCPSSHVSIFHSICNVMEDNYIEHFAPAFLGKRLNRALSYMRAVVYKQSEPVENASNPFGQWFTATIHFGDGGIIKGHFTDEDAERVFSETLPLIEEHLHERDAGRRFELAYQVFDMTKPLWKAEADMSEMLSKMAKDLKNCGRGESGESDPRKAGKPSFSPMANGADGEPEESSKEKRRGKTIRKYASSSDKKSSEGKGSSEKASDEKSSSNEKAESHSEKASDEKESPSEASSDDHSESGKEPDETSSATSTAKDEGKEDTGEKNTESGSEETSSEKSGKEGDSEDGKPDAKTPSDDSTSGSAPKSESSDEGSDHDSKDKSEEGEDESEEGDRSDSDSDTSSDTGTPESEDEDLEENGEEAADDYLKEFEISEEDALKRAEEIKEFSSIAEEERKEAEETPNMEYPLTSEGLHGCCKSCKCRNIAMKTTNSASVKNLYENIVRNISAQVTVTANTLKRIFRNDISEKRYRTSGSVSVPRLQKSYSTARVFTKRKDPDQKKNLHIMIAVDESGSMHGSKISAAQKATIALAEVFAKTDKDIKLSIIGFSADENGYRAVHRHYLNGRNTQQNRLKLLGIDAHANNFDGYTIRYCGEYLKHQKEEHKLLIVISDGIPACYSYANRNLGIADTKMAIKEASRHAKVVGILVGGQDPKVHREMYGFNFLHISKIEELFNGLATLIKRAIKEW